jgi:PiT family inorganic phosphate transporter
LFEIILIVFVIALAYINGANDISKGIATLVGGKILKPNQAIIWGTITTVAGALAGVAITGGLIKTFSSGILSQSLQTTAFPIAVAVGAAGWVLFATRTGMPVSTTHALTGGIVGAALAQIGGNGIVWAALIKKIALPLALSPVVSFSLAWLIFPLLRYALARANNYCLCFEVQQTQLIPVQQLAGTAAFISASPQPPTLHVVADEAETCEQTVSRSGIKLRMADSLHLFTSGLTSFARGLNDTPKIAALLIGTSLLGGAENTFKIFALVAVGMCIGSLLGGRKVLETMSGKITAMDGIEGFTANLDASALVTTATFFSLPLSTTHVTTSAIVGIGVRHGHANWKVVRDILLVWLITLPTAAVFAYLVSLILKQI